MATRARNTKPTPEAQALQAAWIATLPTCTTCTRKVLEAATTCVHCRMEQMYGTWNGTATAVTP